MQKNYTVAERTGHKCPYCGAGKDKIESNQMGLNSPELTYRCDECDEHWHPNLC